ncbi:hypothetical protein [Aquimarina sp. SS2-1]|uniref:hypothetical protein n=1 Tax=Aquimarina besae TaxID=3342247 RepID=UPI003672F90C
MKKLKISVLLFLTSLMFCYCSDNKEPTNEEMIDLFFSEIFKQENTSSKDLYSKYLFEDKAATKLRDTLQNMFDKHISSLKVKKSHLLNKDIKFIVHKYEDSNRDDLIQFVSDDTGGKDIYVITVDNNVEFYVLLKKDKIYSFEYVMKGDEGLFITYY